MKSWKLYHDINILCVKWSLCRRFLFSFVHAKADDMEANIWKEIDSECVELTNWVSAKLSCVVGKSLRCLANRSGRLSRDCQQSLRCALRGSSLLQGGNGFSGENVINFSWTQFVSWHSSYNRNNRSVISQKEAAIVVDERGKKRQGSLSFLIKQKEHERRHLRPIPLYY